MFVSQDDYGYAPDPPLPPMQQGQQSDPQYDPQAGGYDPFAYTRGSLLTPWEGRFQAPASAGGGVAVPEFTPFGYQDFNYGFRPPDQFNEEYQNPGHFTYGDFNPGEEFRAPTEADMKQDPSYQHRMQQGMKALTASKAAQGILKTGGAAKAMLKYGQDYGSMEYGNVYNRRASEHDRKFQQRSAVYGINRGNAAENFDRNVNNDRTGHQLRQARWRDNAAVHLEGDRLGYDVAQGTWDRNFAKARQGWDDEASHRASVAAAANAGANRDYGRAMDEYTMARDEFWTNQDRQYRILDREASRGWDAAYAYGAHMSDLETGRGNAQASGVVGAANAWNGTLGNIGNTAQDAGMLAYSQMRRPTNYPVYTKTDP